MVVQVSPRELHSALIHGEAPKVIDVREEWEFDKVHIEGAELMPLKKLMHEFSAVHPNKEEPVVLYCDLGIRSHHAATLLRAMGYQNVADLEGGLLAYSQQIKDRITRRDIN